MGGKEGTQQGTPSYKRKNVWKTFARGTNPIRRPWTITCGVADEISIMFFSHNAVQSNGSDTRAAPGDVCRSHPLTTQVDTMALELLVSRHLILYDVSNNSWAQCEVGIQDKKKTY